MKKNIITLMVAVALLSGCAVKDTDTTAEKTLKHTANAPFYVIAGVGAAATLAVQGVLIGGAKLAGAKTKKEKEEEAAAEKLKSETADSTIK